VRCAFCPLAWALFYQSLCNSCFHLTAVIKFVADKILLQSKNIDDHLMRKSCDIPTMCNFLSYEIKSHVNLFSDWSLCTCLSYPVLPSQKCYRWSKKKYIYSFSTVLHCVLPSLTHCIKHLPDKETAVDLYNALPNIKPTIYFSGTDSHYHVFLCIKILAPQWHF
jgi:hypothetical protein